MRIGISARKINEKWESWFAWFPVSVEPADGSYVGVWVWLENVERKEAAWYGGTCWRYREKI